MPRWETDLGVEGCCEPAKQGNGRLCAPSSMHSTSSPDTPALGKVCDGEAKGAADGLVNEYTPPSARKSRQITGRILVSCGKRAICSNLGSTIITCFTRLFISR